jgi:hypothetical protein
MLLLPFDIPNFQMNRILKPILSVSILICVGFLSLTTACKPAGNGAQPEAYIENGQIWAFGSVQLAELTLPGSIKLDRSSADQSFDSRQTQYSFYGDIEARTGGRGRRMISYVDYHPDNKKVLAYHYSLDFSLKNDNPDQVYVYAFLRKAGQSYHQRQRIYIGIAKFRENQKTARVHLNNGLKTSVIGDGVNAGQWALHYPNIKKLVLTPYNGRCPKFVGQMPGQNPSQNPAQFRGCRPIPAKIDLCKSKPTSPECKPRFPRGYIQPNRPVEQPRFQAPVNTRTTGLDVVSGDERVFTLKAGDSEAKVVFESNKINIDPAKNAEACRNSFLAIAKTVGGQLNDSCTLKPAPTQSENGMLTCAINVKFNDARTYMDKICNITAVYRVSGTQETQTIQILKK